jgi:plasmid rolling circle replication initiator protein Rep
MKHKSPIEKCKICIEDSRDIFYYEEDNWKQFHTEFCVTQCDNTFVPKYLPKEQVIKYLKRIL